MEPCTTSPVSPDLFIGNGICGDGGLATVVSDGVQVGCKMGKDQFLGNIDDFGNMLVPIPGVVVNNKSAFRFLR